MRWIRSDREGFVLDPVAVGALGLDVVVLQVVLEVVLADWLDAQGGLVGGQDMLVGGVGPGGLAMVEPGS